MRVWAVRFLGASVSAGSEEQWLCDRRPRRVGTPQGTEVGLLSGLTADCLLEEVNSERYAPCRAACRVGLAPRFI